MATDPERLSQALAHAEFPAHKDELVRCALRAHADAETISAMLAIPPVSYANVTEVERSLPIAPLRRETARQQRSFTAAELEDLERNIAEHPIWQELGDSSGS